MTGTLFATMLVKIAVIGGCEGGQIEMDTEKMKHERVEKEYYYEYPDKTRIIRFLTGKSDPFISPILAGYMVYLELDIYWRQKYAVSCRSLSYFSNYVNMIKEALYKSLQNILVFPLRKWSEFENKKTNTGLISSWSENDQKFANILLSISIIYVDLAIVKYDVENQNKYRTYLVEDTFPIARSFPNPLLNQLVLYFPSHFVGANSKWTIEEVGENKLLVFVITLRR